MNIILIISDTFRRDNLTCYAPDTVVRTPNLDAFAEKAVIFDKVYTGSYPTVPQRGDILTGQVGFTRRGWEPLDRQTPVLADMLNDAGYVTQMFSDTPHHINKALYYERGFQGWEWIRGQESDALVTERFDFDTIEKQRIHTRPHPDRMPAGLYNHTKNIQFRRHESDTFVAQTMARAAQWLDRNYDQEKFFLYVDTFDPHEPWDAPEWYLRMYDDSDYDGPEPVYPPYGPNPLDERTTQRARALYNAEATLVDTWVSRIFEKLTVMDRWKDTMVIFTTDHGFLLGEHGLIAKNFDMYEEIVHIPLLVYHPEIQGGWHCPALANVVDISSTILEVSGAQSAETVEGMSLVPAMRKDVVTLRDFAVTHTGVAGGWPVGGSPHATVTDGEWSMLIDYKELPKKLYHLTEDPAQDDNKWDTCPQEASRLFEGFLTYLRTHGAAEGMVGHYTEVAKAAGLL